MERTDREKFWRFYDRNAPTMNDYIKPRDLLPYFSKILPLPTQEFILANVERLGSSYAIFHFIDAIRSRDRSHVEFFDAIKRQSGLGELVIFIEKEFIQKETVHHVNGDSSSFGSRTSSDRVPVESEIINSLTYIHSPSTVVEQPCSSFLRDTVDRRQYRSAAAVADGMPCEEESAGGTHNQLLASSSSSSSSSSNEHRMPVSLDRQCVQESGELKCTITYEQAYQAELCHLPERQIRSAKEGLLSGFSLESQERLAVQVSPPSVASDVTASTQYTSRDNDINAIIRESALSQITSAVHAIGDSVQMEQLKYPISVPTNNSHDGEDRESLIALLPAEVTCLEPRLQSTVSSERETPLSSLSQVPLPLDVESTAERSCGASMTKADEECSECVNATDYSTALDGLMQQPLANLTEADTVSCSNVSTVDDPSSRNSRLPDPLAEQNISRQKCDSGYNIDSKFSGCDKNEDRPSFPHAISLAILSVVALCTVAYVLRRRALR